MTSNIPLPSHWRKMYDNLYLGAWNLEKDGRYVEANVTIESVTKEEVMNDGRKSMCTLLRFKGKRTPMILSKRQGKALEKVAGENPNRWVGVTITLWAETRKVKGEMCRVLSIRSKSSRAEELKEQLAAPIEPEQFDGVPEDPDAGP